MKIDQTLVQRLEELARLELTPTERAEITNDLEQILAMVEQLQAVDTEGVEPLIYLSEERNVLRTDAIGEHLDRKKAMDNAPLSDGQFFKVPKVIK